MNVPGDRRRSPERSPGTGTPAGVLTTSSSGRVDLVRRPAVTRPERRYRDAPERGPSAGLSRTSRLRLLDLLWRIEPTASTAFLTLTYPDRFEADPRTWARDRGRLRDRLRNSHPDLATVWVVETAPRLSGSSAGLYAPHVHCAVYGPPTESEAGRRALRAYLREAWNEIVAPGDADHRAAAVDLGDARSREAARYYLVARDKRQSEEDRVEVLRQYPAGVGRSWGVWNRRALPLAPVDRHDLTADQLDAVEAAMCEGVNRRYEEAGRPRRLRPTGRESLTLSVPDVPAVLDAARAAEALACLCRVRPRGTRSRRSPGSRMRVPAGDRAAVTGGTGDRRPARPKRRRNPYLRSYPRNAEGPLSSCARGPCAVRGVRPSGFEPETFGTGNQRSIQLSYGRGPVKIRRGGGGRCSKSA